MNSPDEFGVEVRPALVECSMDVPPAASTNSALIYLSSLSPSGRRTMQARLERVALLLTGSKYLEPVPWHRLRFEHVAAIRSELQESGLAPASVNASLYALRGVARACWNLGQMNADDYGRIRSVSPVRGSRLPAGRALASGEMAALLGACWRDSTLAGARDAALIAVLYSGGLRRAEAAALGVEDYDAPSGALKVRGKGSRERLVYILGGAAEALGDWLLPRGASEGGSSTCGALFCPIRKDGSMQGRHMTAQAVYNVLRKRGREAGVPSFSPHDLRRTFVGDLLERGVDIVTVQHLAGHANVSTTARYDRRGEEVKARAASTLHVPSRPRTPRT